MVDPTPNLVFCFGPKIWFWPRAKLNNNDHYFIHVVVCSMPEIDEGIDPAQVYILQDVPVFSQIDFSETIFLVQIWPLNLAENF